MKSEGSQESWWCELVKKYPPLSDNEERELIGRYGTHDREKLNELLVMHNVAALFKYARRYSDMSRTQDFNDMMQNGILGFTEAASRFDVGKGVRFLTFAFPLARSMMQKELKKNSFRTDMNTVMSFDDSMYESDDGGGMTKECIIGGTIRVIDERNETSLKENESGIDLEKAKFALQKRLEYRSTVAEDILANLNGESVQSIADRRGKPVDAIRYQIKKGLRILRREIEEGCRQ